LGRGLEVSVGGLYIGVERVAPLISIIVDLKSPFPPIRAFRLFA